MRRTIKTTAGSTGDRPPVGRRLRPDGPPAERVAVEPHGWPDDHADFLAPALDDEVHGETADAEAPPEDEHAPDDALGLYLRQMGSIPLLNRHQEKDLAQRLEETRDRYRHAALMNWRTLEKVAETFEFVHSGDLALDPTDRKSVV